MPDVKHFKSKQQPVIDDDPTGLQRAVVDYNSYNGPARIFFNRDTRTYFVKTYEPYSEDWWEPKLSKGREEVELQRKTTAHGRDQVTDYELKGMANMLGVYVRW